MGFSEEQIGIVINTTAEGNAEASLQRILDLLGGASTQLRALAQNTRALDRKLALNNELKSMAREARAAGQGFQQFTPQLQAWARANGLASAGIDEVIRALDREGAALQAETGHMAGQVNAQLDYWYEKKRAIEGAPVEGRFSADGADLMAEAQASIALLEALLALLGTAGGSGGSSAAPKTSGGGGGGGKKRDTSAATSAIHEVARAQQDALDEELRLMERNRRAGALHTRQEIAELQQLYEKYKENAELRLTLEEKIAEARERLRQEEIAQLDRLNDGILTALRNRYEAQRKLEQGYLDDSLHAWQAWSDETVQAIQAQIDALDQDEQQEGRDEKEQKALRKIAALQMELRYTTDEYGRHELEKELARQEEDLAKQRREWARADEKDRLQAQIAAVQARAQAEQDAIEGQKTALDQVYDQLTGNAALQAEAQQVLGRSQQEMIDLIAAYAPEYEATGKTLGERLYAGLTGAWGSISGWFDGFNSQITRLQDQAAAAANTLANQYYSGVLTGGLTGTSAPAPVTIEQTNNFNTPVASPSAVTEALDEAAGELAARIAG